jgi:hypothetical protein
VLVAEVTLSARILSKEVLPAPEEPMINVAWPGAAKPDTHFTMLSSFVLPSLGSLALSAGVVLTSALKLTSSQLSFIGYLHLSLAWSSRAIGSMLAFVARDMPRTPIVLACFGDYISSRSPEYAILPAGDIKPVLRL